MPVVDCIIGGSPCQNLSMAGLRTGLDGEESSLFYHQIRLVKEMRKHSARKGDNAISPRFMVWENVKGACYCNNGEDFRKVLEEVARIKQQDIVIPRFTEQPSERESGCIVGDGFSIAWRLLDSQYHGVPQHRERICLVADFDGYSAPDVVFEVCEQFSSPEQLDKSVLGRHFRGDWLGKIHADKKAMRFIVAGDREGFTDREESAPDLHRIIEKYKTCAERVKYVNDTDISSTITVKRRYAGVFCNALYGGRCLQPTKEGYIVREFTPCELERLQGFPDDWTNIGEYTDTKGKVRKTTYDKILFSIGNSITPKVFERPIRQISKQFDHTPTMGSLFDGIGGFPLIWEKINGRGTCLWASEINEFGIVVTRKHFPEE